jgi:hypothetical protein
MRRGKRIEKRTEKKIVQIIFLSYIKEYIIYI